MFSQTPNTYCNARYGSFSTVAAAKDACRRDSDCNYVEVNNCDGGKAELCAGSAKIAPYCNGCSRPGCTYRKGT